LNRPTTRHGPQILSVARGREKFWSKSKNQLRVSPDYELCRISERKPGVLDELTIERAKLLDREAAELEKQASQLADEIKELSGEELSRIV
jgi:hypothetical protein